VPCVVGTQVATLSVWVCMHHPRIEATDPVPFTSGRLILRDAGVAPGEAWEACSEVLQELAARGCGGGRFQLR